MDLATPTDAALSAPELASPVPMVRQSPHWVLGVLYLVCMFSYVDRQLIALLLPQIQKALHLLDWQLGFVSGTAFAVLYVFMGLPLSRLADRTHRVRMLAVCLTAWSVAAAACGMASSFLQLVLARAGVAIGEAGGYPPSLSLISDLYPAHRRGTAVAIFLSATTAGSLISLAVGGYVDQAFGWRWTFILAALPGLLLTPLLLASVREPNRGQSDPPSLAKAAPPAGFFDAFRILFSRPLYRWVAAGLAVSNLEIFSLAAWAPSYATRTFGLGPAKVGLGMGLALGIGSGLVMIVAGGVADRLTRRWPRAPIYITVLGYLLFIPLLLMAMAARDFTQFCLLYAAAYGCALTGGPMTIAATQSSVPPHVRGTAASTLIMVATLAGYGLGPPLIGAISDLLPAGSPAERLRMALSVGTAFTAVSGLMMLWGARLARRER